MGSGSLQFRWAVDTDVEGLVALVESAYRGDQSRLGWTTEADLLDGQRTDRDGVAAALDHLLVAVDGDGGPIVGCCQLEQRAYGAYFGMFAIRPGFQGRGWGRQVLDEAERQARAWGAAELRMTVLRQRSELIAWYERRGFARTGATEPFPYGDERYGLPRRDDLEFVVLAKPL